MTFRMISLAAIAASAVSGTVLAAPAAVAVQAPAQARAPQAPPTRAAVMRNIDSRFAVVDANKDGSLSAAEVGAAQSRALQQAGVVQQQRLEAEYKRLDTNKDGSLSLAEFKAAAPPVRASDTPAQMIGQLDTNKDGKISPAEYRVPPLAGFDRADANKDGTLSPQEAQAVRRR